MREILFNACTPLAYLFETFLIDNKADVSILRLLYRVDITTLRVEGVKVAQINRKLRPEKKPIYHSQKKLDHPPVTNGKRLADQNLEFID